MTPTDVLEWIAAGADQITVVALLLIIVFVLVYGMQKERRWLVPGWMLSDCEKKNEKLEARVAEYVQQTEDRVEKLEFIVQHRSTSGEQS